MKRKAFTLSEVLIIIVIIGVIAAFAIPAIKYFTNAQEYKTALKKAIATLNDALETHYALEGLTASDYSSPQDLTDNLFKQRLSTIDGESSFTNGETDGIVFTTTDGQIFYITNGFSSFSSTGNKNICDSYNISPCGSIPNIYIDVNGAKGPNELTISSKYPKDIYEATIYAKKIVPFGYPTQEVMYDKSYFQEIEGNAGQDSGNTSGSSGNTSSGSENTSGSSGQESGGSSSGDNTGTNPEPQNPDPEVNPNPNPENPDPDPEVNPNPDPENPDLSEIPEYDPEKWSSWGEFLQWLREVFGHMFG